MEYQWNNGAFYYGGNAYHGGNAFVNTLTTNLNKIANTNDVEVHGRFNEIANSTDFKAEFHYSETEQTVEKMDGSHIVGADIYISGQEDSWSVETVNGTTIGDYRPSDATTAHELLGHAYQMLHGFTSSSGDLENITPSWYQKLNGKWESTTGEGLQGIRIGEADAVGIENRYRAANDIVLRHWYSGKGIRPDGTGNAQPPPRRLDGERKFWQYLYPCLGGWPPPKNRLTLIFRIKGFSRWGSLFDFTEH